MPALCIPPLPSKPPPPLRLSAQVLVRWSMQRGVPALVKTGSLGRLKENLFGQMDYRLTDEQMVGGGARWGQRELSAGKGATDLCGPDACTVRQDPPGSSRSPAGRAECAGVQEEVCRRALEDMGECSLSQPHET